MNNEFNLMLSGYAICPGNWGMKDESALFYRMYYVCGGEAYLNKGDGDIRLEKGRFYIFPMMSPYTLWQNKEDPLEVLWFHIEMKMDIFMNFSNILIKENSIMYYLLKSMQCLTQTTENYNEIWRLFDIFLTMLNKVIPFQHVENKKMKELLEYIDKHVGEFTVQEMANFVGMERSYFSRKFKGYFNMSPVKYAMAIKMSLAAKALVQGATVYQASVAAGYKDEKAFSRAFHQYMEISPSKYKKSHIQQP